MAYTINVVTKCASCKGEGSRIIGQNPQGQPIYENPCSGCDGDGETTTSRIDDTLIQQVITTQTAHTAELNYIHGKVTAIWNQVKPP